MKNKKIPTSISAQLDQLPIGSQSLFYRLWLTSDAAGVLPLSLDTDLLPLEKKGLLIATKDKIILKSYLSSNYSEVLKPDYNPHKKPLGIIADHGFQYNSDSGEIEIDSNSAISL